MKKNGVAICLILLMASLACADSFLYQIKFLTHDQIKQLSDEKLIDTYTEAKIEEKASAEFHEGAGFSSAKEYQLRKNLLRLIIYLRKEMNQRGLEIDPIEQWLR